MNHQTTYLIALNSVWEKLCELSSISRMTQLEVTTGIFHADKHEREKAFDYLFASALTLIHHEQTEMRTIGHTLKFIVEEVEKL